MKSLLIVDDHLMFGSAMAFMLRQLDPELCVTTVGSVNEAAEQLSAGKSFDLIVLDYDMPGKNGLEGLAIVHQTWPEQVVCLLSGRTDPHLVKAAIASGAIGWIPKTMSEAPLLHALRMMAAGGQFLPQTVLDELSEHEKTWGSLTQVETTVAKLLSEGLADKEIASHLSIAPKTVENHVRSLLKKAKVDNRTKFALAYQEQRKQ